MSNSDTAAVFEIRPVTMADVPALAHALEQLSFDLGDPHRTDTRTLAAACLGPGAACRGVIAQHAGATTGAALISPVFSTTYGSVGVYVSDLWVAADVRGSGLGRALLAAAARLGADTWQASFLKLTVYAENTDAAKFYERLGFRTATRDRSCLLSGTEFASLTMESA